MKLVLDSNVLNSKKFCNWLLTDENEKYLPAVSYMEYLYHHLQRGNTESMVEVFLEQMNVSVVPFGKIEVSNATKKYIENSDFSGNFRDYAIGATALTLDAQLVTNNVENFQWLDEVITLDDVMGP